MVPPPKNDWKNLFFHLISSLSYLFTVNLKLVWIFLKNSLSNIIK